MRAGYRAALAVPLLREDRLLGGLTAFRKTPGEFAPQVVDLLRTFATQSALAIQNARLFLEIEDESRQLEVASQHKSEFLANMSHELRTSQPNTWSIWPGQPPLLKRSPSPSLSPADLVSEARRS